MKKILVLLVSLLVSFNVSAKENNIYYSNYSDWSNFSVNEINSSELIEVKKERRFRWYKNKKVGEYLTLEEGIKKYNNLDKDNSKYSDYSDWSLEKKEDSENVVVEKEKRYLVKRIKPINAIYIFSGSFNSEHVDLNKIEIYDNGKKVGIKPTWTGNYIIDKDEGVVELILDDYYYLDDLTIIIKPINMSDINTMYILASAPIDSESYYFYYWMMYENKGEDNITINVKNFTKYAPQYEEEICSYIPELKYSDEIEELMYYRYKNKLYYFYDYDKEYIDGYFITKEGYEKDESQYIDYYSYKNRDKIEISDYIEITDKKQKLEDYIKSSTEYTIDGVVDYNKNGIYHINIKTYFLDKNIPVIVNILENDKNVISSTVDNLMIDKNNENELLNKYNNLQIEYKKLLEKTKNNSIDYKNNKQENNELVCEKQLEEISLKNDDNEKKLKLSNQAYDYLKNSLLKIDNNEFQFGLSWYLWLLFLIILLIIIIILIIKKRKNKNKF